MSQVLMQPKLYNLRLNLEQVQHVSDGLIENRKSIEERSMDLYDSQVEDIVSQFNAQGVHITVEEEIRLESEAVRAAEIISKLKDMIPNLSMDGMEAALVLDEIEKLNELLFG